MVTPVLRSGILLVIASTSSKGPVPFEVVRSPFEDPQFLSIVRPRWISFYSNVSAGHENHEEIVVGPDI